MPTKTKRKPTKRPAKKKAAAKKANTALAIIHEDDADFQASTGRDKVSPIMDPILDDMLAGEESDTIQLPNGSPFSVNQIRNWYQRRRDDVEGQGMKLRIGGGEEDGQNITVALRELPAKPKKKVKK